MIRIGLGYDIHKLVKNRDLILGGVKIPFEMGLSGHSDADVLSHAITDAVLGAIAKGDIGTHFPDTDEKYKNINSLLLLKEACTMLRRENYKIINIDSNIICQKPKLKDYIKAMRENIASACGINISQVSVKAKTNEEQDSAGNMLSIISQAVVLIENR